MPAPGERIAGRFTLLQQRAGRWIAQDSAGGGRVSLLLIEGAPPSATQAMIDAAWAAAQVQHRAIAPLIDAGISERGQGYLASELCRGENLAERLRSQGRLSPLEVVQTLLPVVAAIAWAHAHEIVHGGLAPDRIMLAELREGPIQPKVVDFGLAELGASSLVYLAPEQTLGNRATAAADVWALAAIVYELVVGQPPFSGDSIDQLCEAIRSASPFDFESHRIAQPELWNVTQCGLAKHASDRLTIRELGFGLVQWLATKSIDEDIAGVSVARDWPTTEITSIAPPGDEPWLRQDDFLEVDLSPQLAYDPGTVIMAPEPPAPSLEGWQRIVLLARNRTDLPLTVQEMFLVTRLDGVTVAEAVARSGLSHGDLCAFLARLAGLGVIRLG